jgi:hypothetical protein
LIGAARSISGRQCEQAVVVHQEPDRENHQHKQQVHKRTVLLVAPATVDLAAVSVTPGNSRRSSTTADSSPRCSNATRITAA